MVDAAWTSAELAHVLCDKLVAKGHLKEKPAFIRTDREAKIVTTFEGIGLDGAKMASFDNPGPLEMLVRRGTNGEAWVQQVVDALITFLPEDAAKASKKMEMDESTKNELAAAQEKTAQRMARLEAQREDDDGDAPRGGKGARGGGGDRERDGGRGGDRDRDDRRFGGDDDEPRGWGDSGGGKPRRNEGGTDSMECYNCGGVGHSSRDCPEPPKEKGKSKGKGRSRDEMKCLNCKQLGHKSRDCPEPVDEDAVRERLAAKAAAGGGGGGH